MNYTELNALVTKIINAYPVWNPDGRRSLLIEKLQDLDSTRAFKGIDDLICGFRGQSPTMNDILEAIRTTKISRQSQECLACGNTGWIELDPKGHGNVERCECKGHSTKTKYDDDLTYDGKKIASKKEKVQSFYRGLEKYYLEESQTSKTRDELLDMTSLWCNVERKEIEQILNQESEIF